MKINTNGFIPRKSFAKSQGQLSRSLERISSGLRINSARDDAAGLAISNRMTAQIRGLDTALNNISQGEGILRTSEGAFNEIVNALQRMRQLSVQSANDTLSTLDRSSLQGELAQLQAEVNRIVEGTSVNGIKVLDGDLLNFTIQSGAVQGDVATMSINRTDGQELGRQMQRVSLRGVNTNIAIGEETATEVIEISPAVPAQLITAEVPEIIDPNNPGTPDVIVSEAVFSDAVPFEVLVEAIPAVYSYDPGDDNTDPSRTLVTPGVPAVVREYVPPQLITPAVIIPGTPPVILQQFEPAVYTQPQPAVYDYNHKGELIINGVNIRATHESDDQLSTAKSTASAIAKAAAINDAFEFTGVQAIVGPTVLGSPNEVGPGPEFVSETRVFSKGIDVQYTNESQELTNLPLFIEDTDLFFALDNSRSNKGDLQSFISELDSTLKQLVNLSNGHTIRAGISFYGDHGLAAARQFPDFALIDLSDDDARQQLVSDVSQLDLNVINDAVAEDMHNSIAVAQSQAWSTSARQHLIMVGQGDADHDGENFTQESIEAAHQFLDAAPGQLAGKPQRLISTIKIDSRLDPQKVVFDNDGFPRNDETSSVRSNNDGFSYAQRILVTATQENPETIVTSEFNVSSILDTGAEAFISVDLAGFDVPLTLDNVVSPSTTSLDSVKASSLRSGDLVINGVDILSGVVGTFDVLANDANGALVNQINSKTANTGVTASINNGVISLSRDFGEINVFTTADGEFTTGFESADFGRYLVVGDKVIHNLNANSYSDLATQLTDKNLGFQAEAVVTDDVELGIRLTFDGGEQPVNIQSYGFNFTASGEYNGSELVRRDDYYPDYEVLTGPLLGGELNESNYVVINGAKIAGFNVQANDATGELRDAINAYSQKTGVVAQLDSGYELMLIANDGRNIKVETFGQGGAVTGLQNIVQGGDLTLQSKSDTDIYFGIAGETDMNDALGDLGGGPEDRFFGVNTEFSLDRLNITTREGANQAIRSLDLALDQAVGTQTQIGAMLNRLESTANRVQVNSQNLSASRSRITDADFAYETVLMTRAQILQQASTSILAQAKVTPQLALTLLESL
jgi:flagellin-like hook-associated protein FlgL